MFEKGHEAFKRGLRSIRAYDIPNGQRRVPGMSGETNPSMAAFNGVLNVQPTETVAVKPAGGHNGVGSAVGSRSA